MDTNAVKRQNLTYGSGGDCNDSDDNDDSDGDFQQTEVKDTNTDITSPTQLREQVGQFNSQCNTGFSELAARKQDQQESGTHHKGTFQNIFMNGYTLIVTAVVLGLAVYSAGGEWGVGGEKYLGTAIRDIRSEFPSQLNTTWEAFSACIKQLQETPTKPSVFLLLYETEDWTSACLAWKIANITAHFLSATNPDPIVLYGTDIENNQTLVEDYGILLNEYDPMVRERYAMIVKDLHRIPGIVAQSFHWFCDTVTPLVDKAVFLFTMKVSRVSHAKDNPTMMAERELKRLWNGQVDEDKLGALIVRITDNVMMIMPENNRVSCPAGAVVPEREHL
jgi:hypothetical protein